MEMEREMEIIDKKKHKKRVIDSILFKFELVFYPL